MALIGVVAFVGAGWVAASAPTETVTQQAHEQSVVTTTSTEAVVTGSDALWPQGTVLENKPVYLLNATPEASINATTRVSGTQQASVTHRFRLTVHATRNGEDFYSNTRTLVTNTGSGSVVRTNVTVNMSELRSQVDRVQQKVGTAGVVTAKLTLITQYETDRYADRTAQSTKLGVGSTSYTLGDGLASRASHSKTITTEVSQPPDAMTMLGLSSVGFLSVLGAAFIIRQEPEEIDLEEAQVDLHRQQFAQWISPGRIPMGTQKEFIELSSLEALVDAAIDTEERVVHDERRDLYAAFSENVVYYYSPGGGWMETMFPRLDTSEGPGGAGGPGGPPGGGFPSGDLPAEPQDEMFGMGTFDDGPAESSTDDGTFEDAWDTGDAGDPDPDPESGPDEDGTEKGRWFRDLEESDESE